MFSILSTALYSLSSFFSDLIPSRLSAPNPHAQLSRRAGVGVAREAHQAVGARPRRQQPQQSIPSSLGSPPTSRRSTSPAASSQERSRPASSTSPLRSGPSTSPTTTSLVRYPPRSPRSSGLPPSLGTSCSAAALLLSRPARHRRGPSSLPLPHRPLAFLGAAAALVLSTAACDG
jgi:hypothetical protein